MGERSARYSYFEHNTIQLKKKTIEYYYSRTMEP